MSALVILKNKELSRQAIGDLLIERYRKAYHSRKEGDYSYKSLSPVYGSDLNKVLVRMVKKGLLTRRKKGRVYVYRIRINKKR